MRSSWVGSRVRRDRVRGAGIDARGRCAAVPEETLAILKSGAEEALAADGVARTRLGYEVLVKLKMDDLLEQACVRMPVSADGAHPPDGGDGEALRRRRP
jgi:hypothetical protein